MLNAYGTKLNEEALRVNSVVQNGVLRQEMVDYFNNLSVLATESISEFKKIKPPSDENLNIYYNLVLSNAEDLATSAADIVYELSKSSHEYDQIAYEKIVNYSNRVIAKDKARQKSAIDFVENSPIRKLFEESAMAENKIVDEIAMLEEKYRIENNQSETNNEASPSSSLEASPQASPSATPIISLDALPSLQSTGSAND